jgi:4-diphosphocytidyl-2-C-methyl-D-erythritol kinase
MTMLRRRTDSSLVAQAPAKVNLYLRIVGRRADGYHEIETVMTAVDLFDTLIFSPSEDRQLSLAVIRAEAGRLPAAAIPADHENLVLRAARLLQQSTNSSKGARITLVKRIPSAAGLGGGSSDAAATLYALNRLWSLGLSRHEVCDLASRLGSDVPFFLGPTATAICRGRGEIIEPLTGCSGLTGTSFVLAKPASGLSTPSVYQEYRPERERGSLEPLRGLLRIGRIEQVARHLRNDLQSPAERLNRDVGRLAGLFDQQPFWGHQLSGSGTAYFGMCRSRPQALAIAGRLRQRGVPWVAVARPGLVG